MNFTPANELEKALLAAVADASTRPAFYRTLIDSTIYIIPMGDKPAIENGVIKKDSQIAMQFLEKDGNRFTPFYSSPEMILRAITGPVEYFALAARAFFEMTRGSALILNPNSYGKEFFPDEIARLLDGKMFEPQVSYTVEKDEKILIGQPAKYPRELTLALSKLFKGKSTVKKAFLAHYVNPARDPAPGLLIAVDLDNDKEWDKVMGDAGVVIGSLHPDHKFVDFIRYEESGAGPSGYFKKSVKPFYQRGLMASMFGR